MAESRSPPSRPKSRATALASSEAAPWQDLPPELLPCILAQLPANEVPCTARLVCKAAAAALSSPAHTTVRLSQPSPHGEFARRWGAPGAMRPLTLNRRRRLLALTAASGCLHNLAWLAEHAGCSLDVTVLKAAAAAGRLEACRWLLQQQGGEGLSAALAAAVKAGQRSTLEALLAYPGARDLTGGWADGLTIAVNAARSGHVGLMDWLLARLGRSGVPHAQDGWDSGAGWQMLIAAAGGCDLPTLQRLHRTHQRQLLPQLRRVFLPRLLVCAASSPTPDWRAKVEWVQACLGAQFDGITCIDAAACPGALERLTWLRARGCPWGWQAVDAAARAGNVEALSYLLAEGCKVQFSSALGAAAAGGHLAALEVLHTHGLAATNPEPWAAAAADAACEGQLPAVRWMLERRLIELQTPAPGDECLSMLGCAAQSGNVELLALLRAGGCRWWGLDLYAAAYGGSEEALEWAVGQGCPVQGLQGPYDEDSDPYFAAASGGDWATLACLRRLGVPWRPLDEDDDGTFTSAVRQGCSVPILRRLLELGCPVDWVRAAEAAEDRGQAVRAWLKEEEEQRRGVEGAPPQL